MIKFSFKHTWIMFFFLLYDILFTYYHKSLREVSHFLCESVLTDQAHGKAHLLSVSEGTKLIGWLGSQQRLLLLQKT